MRAIWVHLFDNTLKTAAGIDKMIADVAAANLNTVIVEVVRRQDAYYDSSVLPRTTDPSLEPGLDVVARVTSAAHAKGLAVHAWIPVAPTYHGAYDELPRPKGWVWTEHGPNAPEEDRWVSRRANGDWTDYLDPGLPEVRAHIVAIARELAAYPIDAVHLDYIRYAADDMGYNPRALDAYRSETGATGTPVPSDPAWSNWRRAKVTQLLSEVRSAVRAVDSSVDITAAVIAQAEGPSGSRTFAQTKAYAQFFQDWESWLRAGLLDMAMPMNYFREYQHAAWFRDWVAFETALASQVDPLIVGGQAGYLNSVEDSLSQLDQLAGLDGVVVYSYQQNVNAEPFDGLLQRLRERWPTRAPLP